jgi:hypothetical protein
VLAYCGPRRRLRLDRLADAERRRLWAQEKSDGAYVELHVADFWPSTDTERHAGPGGGRTCPVCGRRILDGSALACSSACAARTVADLTGRPDRRFHVNRRHVGAIHSARYRSGALVSGSDGHGGLLDDVRGLQIGLPAGSVLCGELMAHTPAALRWSEAHAGRIGVVLFDVLRVGAESVAARPYRERYEILSQLADRLDDDARQVVEVARSWCCHLSARFDEVVSRGGEGLVLIDPDAPAGSGKWKLKRSDTLDARVVELLPDEGVARVLVNGLDPFTVSTPPFPVRVGDVVEVAHVGWYDGTWTPRHAHAVRPRPDLSPSL